MSCCLFILRRIATFLDAGGRRMIIILAMALLQTPVSAQLCDGSKGDALIMFSFGNSTDPPAPLPPGNTGYQHTWDYCPLPGQYSFNTILFGCYNNALNTIVTDHTPDDVDGRYMFINAGRQAGDLFKDTVQGLCAGGNYELSAWLSNPLKPLACTEAGSRPDVTLTVENLTGKILGSYRTGEIAENSQFTWKEYGTTFQLPVTENAVIIRITDNTRGNGSCGNIIAMDDIALRICGAKISAGIGSDFSSTISTCEGDSATISLHGKFDQGYDHPTFQWQVSTDKKDWKDIPGATAVDFVRKPTTQGTYFYRLAIADGSFNFSPSCKIYSDPVIVTVAPLPYVQLTSYLYGCYGSPVVLTAGGGSEYEWSGPNGFTSASQTFEIPFVRFSDQGVYHLKVTTAIGCSDTGSLNLLVSPAVSISVPTGNTICEGDSIQLSAGGALKYVWSAGVTTSESTISDDSIPNPVVRPSDTTRYMVVGFNQYGCTDTGYVSINVWKKPVVSAGPDKKMRVNVPITLDGTVSGTDISYYWSPGEFLDNPSRLQPVADPPASTSYRLFAESSHGCGTSSDEMYIKVYDKVLIPNAFSPNGDGINDKWIIDPIDLFPDAIVEVFNRYGKVVFVNKGLYHPWDGTANGQPLPVGTYYYIVDLKLKNEKPMSGSITILR